LKARKDSFEIFEGKQFYSVLTKDELVQRAADKVVANALGMLLNFKQQIKKIAKDAARHSSPFSYLTEDNILGIKVSYRNNLGFSIVGYSQNGEVFWVEGLPKTPRVEEEDGKTFFIYTEPETGNCWEVKTEASLQRYINNYDHGGERIELNKMVGEKSYKKIVLNIK
jgi:hypothetical protein